MKQKMKIGITAVLLLAMVAALFPAASASGTDTSQLGKLVDTFAADAGLSFELKEGSRIFVLGEEAPSGALLQTVQLVQRQFAADGLPSGTPMPIVWGKVDWIDAGDIVVSLDTQSDIGSEGYRLEVGSSARVTAGDVNGLLYGLNMLQKHLRVGGTCLQGFTATDTPDTRERTIHLDCGRKYFTREWICNFIREMSWMGYNSLEFHFSEDGGFRADFWGGDAYYQGVFQPENDFSWACGSLSASWVADAYWQDYENEDYLSTADLIAICETAAEYHIDIIPSFDTPAHVDYLTWIFEQNYRNNPGYTFLHDGDPYKASSVNGCINYCKTTGMSATTYKWPDYAALDITNDVARAFAFEIYEDVANFFKEYAGSTKFNVGGDEVVLKYSKTWNYDDLPGYLNSLDDLLNDLGYTTRIFNDFIGTTKYFADLNDFNDDIEILYWNSPFNPITGKLEGDDDNYVESVDFFVEDGRTLYNVIQTGTYYCTRVTSSNSSNSAIHNRDARDPEQRQWSVFNANEQGIYNDWYPGDFGEKGDYDETAIVDDSLIAGAYFCLWFDYQVVNTEQEIWYGARDKNYPDNTYYLLDRMWSNTIKMWNWDINTSGNSMGQVTYAQFAQIRDLLGDFPGLADGSKGCSEKTVLPEATYPIREDRYDLGLVLSVMQNAESYTSDSYQPYLEAYNAALEVYGNTDASESQVTMALAELVERESALVSRGYQITVELKTVVEGEEQLLDTRLVELGVGQSAYELYLEPMDGYVLQSVTSGTFRPLAAQDGSGFLCGNAYKDAAVVVWYTNAPQREDLDRMLGQSLPKGGETYEASGWAVYQAALEEAENFVITAATTQGDVDAVTEKLRLARVGLTVAADKTEILTVEKMTSVTDSNKLVGLKVTTSSDVASLAVEGQTLTIYSGHVNFLENGQVVKIWVLAFPVSDSGTYTVTATDSSGQTVTSTVDITVAN